MIRIERERRRTDEMSKLGLRCASHGLSLAGVSLLRNTADGFLPRSSSDIAVLMRAAYGTDFDDAQVSPWLDDVAWSLGRGDVGLAKAIAAWMLLPELDWDAAVRLANAEQRLEKFNPNEPRDWHGRWTVGLDSISEGSVPPNHRSGNSHKPSAPRHEYIGRPGRYGAGAVDHSAPRVLVSSTTPGEDSYWDEPEVAEAPKSRLETAYDELDPVEFAKKVTEFGLRLGEKGRGFSDSERQDAKAEYDFVQRRLSFWQNYEYLPPDFTNSLTSAAVALYTGAVNSGLIPVGGKGGGLPESMLAVGGALAFEDQRGKVPEWSKPAPAIASELLGDIVAGENDHPKIQLGGVLNNSDVGINWNNGTKEQGLPFDAHIELIRPGAKRLRPGAKTFDNFNPIDGDATNNKTINTLAYSYVKDPRQIYRKLRMFIDQTVDYSPRLSTDVDPDQIKMKSIQLLVRFRLSPEQKMAILQAEIYGAQRGVHVNMTRNLDGYQLQPIGVRPVPEVQVPRSPRISWSALQNLLNWNAPPGLHEWRDLKPDP